MPRNFARQFIGWGVREQTPGADGTGERLAETRPVLTILAGMSLMAPCGSRMPLRHLTTMRIVITGATGLIGAALLAQFPTQYETPIVIVRTRDAAARLPAGTFDVRVADVGDPEALREAFTGAQIVLHAAAVWNRQAHPRVFQWTNVAGTQNALAAAAAAGSVRRFVSFSSTDVTLHNAPRVGWKESRSIAPSLLGDFSRAQLLAEELVVTAGGARFETAVLRPARIWGAADLEGLASLADEATQRGAIQLGGTGKNLLAVTHIANLATAAWRVVAAGTPVSGVYQVVDQEIVTSSEFFGELAQALGTTTSRPSRFFITHYLGTKLRQRWGKEGLPVDETLRRGRSSSFDCTRLKQDFDLVSEPRLATGMREVATVVSQQGGLAALARRMAAPPRASDVDAQVALAGGD